MKFMWWVWYGQRRNNVILSILVDTSMNSQVMFFNRVAIIVIKLDQRRVFSILECHVENLSCFSVLYGFGKRCYSTIIHVNMTKLILR